MNKKLLLRQYFILPFYLLLGLMASGQTLSESFDATTFPPAGWTNVSLGATPEYVFDRATETSETDPNNITPHSGAGMARYDAFNFEAGEYAELVTPALNFTGGPQTISFWMYRDSRYSLIDDSLEVFINASSQTSAGGLKLGVVYRHYDDFPAESMVGWYKYTFKIPPSFNTATNYLAFVANSDYGTEMVIDDISVNPIPPINGAVVDIITPNSSCNPLNTVLVKLTNKGTANITAGAATITLQITGPNAQSPLTATNANTLMPGDTATLSFSPSFTTAGTNEYSAYIQSLTGDVFFSDDSLYSFNETLPPPANAPQAEDFEGTVPGWLVSQITGSGNWALAGSVTYPLYSPAYTLPAKSGSTVAHFDSYNFDQGTVSRLTSNCFNIPANANSDCDYIAGFYFTQDAQYDNLDSITVNITKDGGNSFERLGLVKRQDSTLSTLANRARFSKPEWRLYTFDISSFAGQTVQFAFDAYSDYGNSMAIDSFFVAKKTVATNVALASGAETGTTIYPALSNCTDAGGWTYYADNNSARYLFGIEWDPGKTGANAAAKAQATATLNVDRKWFSAENIPNLKAAYTMQRYWDVDLNGAAITSPVNVRFFYSQRELDSINKAKDDFIAANPGSIGKSLQWFKTISGPFVPSAASVTPDGVINAITLTNTNTGGAKIDGILYAQFDGIFSFTGGTAVTSVEKSTPVPVTLLSFNAVRTGLINKLTWATSQELNTSKFIVERSTDGRIFNAIGQVAAVGNSSNMLTYSFTDNYPVRGINYYRLKITDKDNSEKISGIKNVRNEGSASVSIYPNPVKDRLEVNITSDKKDKASLLITDINGKVLYQNVALIAEGINYLHVQTAALKNSTYIIKIQLETDLVVKKFNKL